MPFREKFEKKSRGFALPTVIFMMVTVAAIMGYMVKLLTLQSATVDLALLATRADLAARSAVEWATYQVRNNDACPGATPTINGFTVVLFCNSASYQEGAVIRTRYDIAVQTDSAGGDRTSPDYAFRQINFTLILPSG